MKTSGTVLAVFLSALIASASYASDIRATRGMPGQETGWKVSAQEISDVFTRNFRAAQSQFTNLRMAVEGIAGTTPGRASKLEFYNGGHIYWKAFDFEIDGEALGLNRVVARFRSSYEEPTVPVKKGETVVLSCKIEEARRDALFDGEISTTVVLDYCNYIK